MTRIGMTAPYLDGAPTVVNTAFRDVMFPTPDTHQWVRNLETGFMERYTGSIWAKEIPLGSMGPVISVLARGAVGDGTTDDSAAVLDAIATAIAKNGTVHFPNTGNPYIVTNIQATGGSSTTLLRFTGEGFGSGIKLKTGSATTVFFITGIGAVTFENLLIDGNRANCPGGLATIRSDVSDTIVRACKIQNGNQDAIFITPDGLTGPIVAVRATVVGNHFLNCGNSGYGGVGVAAEQVQGLVVASNVCDSMGGGLCDVEPFGAGAASDSVVIVGNTVRNTQSWGIPGAIQVTSDNASNPVGTGQNAVDHVVIASNVVNTTGANGVGIYVQSSRRTLVTGNYIYNTNQSGIFIDADAARESKYVSVLGNFVVDPSAGAGGHDGIRLNNAQSCVISGNVCLDTRGVPLMARAVREQGTSTNNWFGPVFSTGATVETITLVGTPATMESAGPYYVGGLLRVRAQGASRYRADFNRTSTALNITTFDDTGSVYQPIVFNEGNIQLDVGGDINSTSGGFRQSLSGWSQITTVAASQTDVALTDAVAARGRVMDRPGSITSVGLNVSTARSAGTLTVKVQKSTDGGATWNTVAGPQAVLNTNVKGSRATFAKDTYAFAAGDMLRLTVTTDSAWLPTANNLDAVLGIEL